MDDGAVALALGAGVVAAVNPCGFALLPAYLSLLVLDGEPDRAVAVARAVKATVGLTAGFMAVFAAFGLAITPVAATVQQYLPAFTVILGLLLACAGGWVLSGRPLWSPSLSRRGQPRPLTGSLWSMAGFGASYAVASLGCTIAPFLAVVVTAFRSGEVADGLVLFLAYAGGMGVVVGTASIAIALAQQAWLQRVRRAGPLFSRLGGALLIVAGGYVAWYGAWELRVLHGSAGADPVVDAAAEVQQWLASNAATVGAGGFLLILLMLLGIGWLTRHRRTARPQGIPHDTTDDSHEAAATTARDDRA